MDGMLVFPSALLSAPYSFDAARGPLVGYVTRVRRRVPVYRDAAAPAINVTTSAVLMIDPDGDPWGPAAAAPGAALLWRGELTAYATSPNPQSASVSAVLTRAAALASHGPLLTWDASRWDADMYALRGGAPEACDTLRAQPVLCLRSYLEHQEVDALSLSHACSLLSLPRPGVGVLSAAYAVQRVLGRIAEGAQGQAVSRP